MDRKFGKGVELGRTSVGGDGILQLPTGLKKEQMEDYHGGKGEDIRN